MLHAVPRLMHMSLSESSQPSTLNGLEASLVARRAYAKFRGQVALLPRLEFDLASLRRNLRRAVTLLVRLSSSEAFPRFRATDRQHVALLQRRILAFLLEPNSLSAGLALYREFEACVDLLALINRREDLRQHDLVHLGAWLNELTAAPQPGYDPRTELEPYRALLFGLDSELDRVLEGELVIDRATLTALLQRLVDSERAPLGERPTKRDQEHATICVPPTRQPFFSPTPVERFDT